eukprot:TRINITY_DN18713_c0_g1_i2.p1 TRINITY_DN18713_c0_g1~~TRINITY_DN18713_c0_g1_i2.p1  ORF type:complete len:213 (+),score=53.72 TRINITY_DN18713_c0_g1_i2:83-640(+)
MGVSRLVVISFTIICTSYRVGGEFETVYEVGIYGTRPRDLDDNSAGLPGSEYYKYQELSEVNKQLSSIGTTEVISSIKHSPSVQKTDQGRIKNQRGVGPGTCYQCSTLSETAQRAPDNLCYNITRYKELKEEHSNETGWEPPGLEPSQRVRVSTCEDTQKYCKVRKHIFCKFVKTTFFLSSVVFL